MRERERETGGNVNCWLVKVQGQRLSDNVWGVEAYEGRTMHVMAVMVCWSSLWELVTIYNSQIF